MMRSPLAPEGLGHRHSDRFQDFQSQTLLAAGLIAVLTACTPTAVNLQQVVPELPDTEHEPLALDDRPLPPQVQLVPKRPKPLIELGDPFLSTGPIRDGIEVPGGAVLQPSLLVFGELRSALQSFDRSDQSHQEWTNRLDVFANLQLSGTERLLLGLSPLGFGPNTTGYEFGPGEEEWQDETNGRIRQLFFEGDLGEMFPGLDPRDRKQLDYGFSIGRQPLFVQQGLLLNDNVDSVGVTRNTLMTEWASNLRLTAFFGWDDLNRSDPFRDDSAQILGLGAQADGLKSTISADLLWVWDRKGDSDALYFGVGSVQRLGLFSAALRVATSQPVHESSAEAGKGTLLFAEFSRPIGQSHDVAYLNTFLAVDEFSSAGRGPDAGGTLNRTGILFETAGMGQYRGALDSGTENSVGGSIGYQAFFQGLRRQAVVELGWRDGWESSGPAAVALGARFQQAVGQRMLVRCDGFVGAEDEASPNAGLRIELRLKF